MIQNKELEIRIYYDKDANKANHKSELKNTKLLKCKKSRDIIFFNNNDMTHFIFLLRKNYYTLTNNYLFIESIKIS